MADKDDLHPLPRFLTAKKCVECEEQIPKEDFEEIGFFYKGKFAGKLFARYKCSNCATKGQFIFGDENYTIEKLCSFIIVNSRFLTKGEKAYWMEKYFGEEENGNDKED